MIVCGIAVISPFVVKGAAAAEFQSSLSYTGFDIFLNFLSFMGFTYWIVTFLVNYLHITPEISNFGLSLFWFLHAAGCMLAGIGLMFIKVDKYIIYSVIIALIGYIMMLIAISVLGLGCSCIYASSISFGTLLLKKHSPRLVSFFIASAGASTMDAQLYSSYIQGAYGIPPPSPLCHNKIKCYLYGLSFDNNNLCIY